MFLDNIALLVCEDRQGFLFIAKSVFLKRYNDIFRNSYKCMNIN
nr:MAG TPA: hypothetical protein [Caudoviricetes sp.]